MKLTQLLINYFQNNDEKVSLFSQQIQAIILNSIYNNNYDSIISEIFERLDLEQTNGEINNSESDQVDQYDEMKSLNRFKEQHKMASITKKFFYIQSEIIKSCNECDTTTYNFYYLKYLLIKLDKEEKDIKLIDKILSQENQSKKRKMFI